MKDYLHLYLRCWGLLTIKNMGFSDRESPYENGEWALSGELYHKIMLYDWGFKPILRPLSSMTGEEEVERGKVILSARDEGLSEMAEVVRWQLSKHFDLFGLINAGLAIDATTV